MNDKNISINSSLVVIVNLSIVPILSEMTPPFKNWPLTILIKGDVPCELRVLTSAENGSIQELSPNKLIVRQPSIKIHVRHNTSLVRLRELDMLNLL